MRFHRVVGPRQPRLECDGPGEVFDGLVDVAGILVSKAAVVVGVGMAGRQKFTYHQGQTLRLHVADQAHPITRGLTDWEMVDETYTTPDLAPDCTLLLTTDHPNSMRHIAWTRQYRNARVFNTMSRTV